MIKLPVHYFDFLMKRVEEFNEELKEIELEPPWQELPPPVDPVAVGGEEGPRGGAQ